MEGRRGGGKDDCYMENTGSEEHQGGKIQQIGQQPRRRLGLHWDTTSEDSVSLVDNQVQRVVLAL
jgi:hypothetical protein